MVRYYYAAFIPDEESGFSIFCPDFPEVASQGETVEECIDMAAEAIALSVEEYVKARKPLPEPCRLEEARRRIEKELAELEAPAAGEILYQLISAPIVDMSLRHFLLTQNGPAPCRCGANTALLLEHFGELLDYLFRNLFMRNWFIFVFKRVSLYGINALDQHTKQERWQCTQQADGNGKKWCGF